MAIETKRLTPTVTVPAFLLRDREVDMAEVLKDNQSLRAENQILLAKLAKLEGPDWSRSDSITYQETDV